MSVWVVVQSVCMHVNKCFCLKCSTTVIDVTILVEGKKNKVGCLRNCGKRFMFYVGIQQVARKNTFTCRAIFGGGTVFTIQIQSHEPTSSVQSLSRVRLLVTPWTAAHQASLSITNSRSLLKLMSIASVMTCNHLILCRLLLTHLQSFPVSGSFQMSQFFTSGDQSIGVPASVLPMNIQDWFPLEWTGWISLLSKGLSRVFSNITVQNHQFFGAQLSF